MASIEIVFIVKIFQLDLATLGDARQSSPGWKLYPKIVYLPLIIRALVRPDTEMSICYSTIWISKLAGKKSVQLNGYRESTDSDKELKLS